jgi:hypothetical protein
MAHGRLKATERKIPIVLTLVNTRFRQMNTPMPTVVNTAIKKGEKGRSAGERSTILVWR